MGGIAVKRQTGVSTAGIALVVVVLAAGGGGFLGWQQHQELARTKTDLASTKSALDKASADAATAKADAGAARKELEEQKAAFEQMRADRDAAKAFLETERAHAARLQGELSLAREQIAHMRTRPSSPAQYAPPSVVQPRPLTIQAIPAPRPQGAVMSPMQAAPAPAQGFGRQQ
jgi:uncharacterized protein HemX